MLYYGIRHGVIWSRFHSSMQLYSGFDLGFPFGLTEILYKTRRAAQAAGKLPPGRTARAMIQELLVQR